MKWTLIERLTFIQHSLDKISRMEALAGYRSPEGLQLLVVTLWMRLCILPHFRDLLNCWNLWSEEKSTICTQASGMFQNRGPGGSYLSASTCELACLAFPQHQSGEPCEGSSIILLETLWHLHLDFLLIQFHWIEQKTSSSVYYRYCQALMDLEAWKNNTSLNMFYHRK